MSAWASAPFFANNTLGELEYEYDADGRPLLRNDVATMDARMRVFDNSIRQLLWPEKRTKDPLLDSLINKYSQADAEVVKAEQAKSSDDAVTKLKAKRLEVKDRIVKQLQALS